MKEDIKSYYPKSRQHWRQWLSKNHVKEQSVWLICYKQKAKKPAIPWTELVDEALCFGWIDSIRKSLDDEKFIQLFSKRKPRSNWSKINKDKIIRLTADGLMMKAGLDVIDVAKKNGSWTLMDAVEKLKIPTDLGKKFKEQPAAKKFFVALPRSEKKRLLHWVIAAKKAETRHGRIEKFIAAMLDGVKPI